MLQQPQAPGNPMLALPDLGDSADADSQEAKTPWWRRRRTIVIAAIVLLILILAGVALPLLNQKPKTVYATQPVTQGDLSITIGATGPLTSSVYNLGFTGTGVSGATIKEIDVKVGDKVKKGQILAKVDPTTLQNAYDQQLAVVQTDEAAVASAQNNRSAQTAAGNTSVAANQTALAQDQKAQSITQQSGQASVNLAQQTLTNDQNALNTAQQQVNASNNQAYQQLQSDLNSCHSSATATAVAAATATTSSSGSSSSTCTSMAYAKYNSTTASNKATVQNAQAKVEADQKALNTAQIAANSNNQAAAAKITADQNAIANAQASANTSSTSQQGSITSAQQQLNQALIALKQAKQNLDNATLKAPNNGTVTVVNGNVGGSPGVPSDAANSSTTTSSSTFIQIVDTSSQQIQANVNETDTANLKIGEAAIFTVNAYSGKTFRGTISAISPNGQTVSNVVSYPVTIDVDHTSLQGASLLPNMTANVTITVIQRTGAILIPVDAVNYARLAAQSARGSQAITQQEVSAATQQARQMYTTLQSNNPDIVASDSPVASYVLEKDSQRKLVAKPVVLGLTDGVSYEVLDGLTTSDVIVTGATGGGAIKATGTSTSGSSSGGGPGGGGPGGGGPGGP